MVVGLVSLSKKNVQLPNPCVYSFTCVLYFKCISQKIRVSISLAVRHYSVYVKHDQIAK